MTPSSSPVEPPPSEHALSAHGHRDPDHRATCKPAPPASPTAQTLSTVTAGSCRVQAGDPEPQGQGWSAHRPGSRGPARVHAGPGPAPQSRCVRRRPSKLRTLVGHEGTDSSPLHNQQRPPALLLSRCSHSAPLRPWGRELGHVGEELPTQRVQPDDRLAGRWTPGHPPDARPSCAPRGLGRASLTTVPKPARGTGHDGGHGLTCKVYD